MSTDRNNKSNYQKLTTMTTIRTLNTRNFFIMMMVMFFGISFVSCSTADEPMTADGAGSKIEEARVTFTYTVPEELFKYAEITVCYNNNEGTDAKWQPMLDRTFTVTYDLKKFPVTAPVVMVYDTTNRPAYGVDVDWDITMDVEAVLTIDGRKEVRATNDVYTINGDLGTGIDALMRNVLDRTFAVKISKSGDLQFVK